jgi:hypothetical protein
MADKYSTQRPITFSKFKAEVDLENIDVEDLNIDTVANMTNLTPNRKFGSLKQFGGTSFATLNGTNLSAANLPTPGGTYLLVDFYSFNIDRDNTEITMLIFKNASNITKIYINPYWNPNGNFSNFNELKNEETWIYEWLELTENTTSNVISTNDGINTIELTTALGQVDYYYNAWFMVNENLDNTDLSKYNYVDSYLQTGNQFLLKASTSTWNVSDTVRMFRFPMLYFYKAITPNAEEPDYSNAGKPFDAIPTDFINGINELKIACGKENKPLSLGMVYKRNYLVGNDPMSYDGFWFDFQQPQQVLYKSVISSYGDSIGTVSTSYVYITPTDRTHFLLVAPATPYIKLKYIGSSADRVKIISSSTLSSVTQYAYENGIHTITLKYSGGVGDASFVDLKAVFDTYLSSLFEATMVGTPAGILGTWDMANTFVYGVGSTIGVDAGNNKYARNLFLGTQVQSITPSVNTDPGCPMIFSLILENRNEVIIGHGNICSTPSLSASGVKLFFNCWFSRKITDIIVYNGESIALSSATVSATNTYPYFSYLKGIGINELSMLFQMSFDNPIQAINGEANSSFFKVDDTKGYNSYLFSTNSWYLHICKDSNAINTQGVGLTFITNTNRFIDEDITMNYTRIAKFGQVNGRFFIIGCKNNIEKELYESDDNINYNTLAAGVSSYDCFSRNNLMTIDVGNKDINRAIETYNGYLFLVKDTNVFLVDISTGSELDFRIVKTDIGRGVLSPEQICYTPHGICMASSDGVYLLNPQGGTKPILTAFNGRLEWYRTYFATREMNMVYYNEYDELFLMQVSVNSAQPNYIMVYNFQSQTWTTIEHNSTSKVGITAYIKARTNANREVLFANVNSANYAYNIVKFDELSSNSINSAGTNEIIAWTLKTHLIPLGGKLQDILLNAFQIHFDYSSAGLINSLLTINRNNETSPSYTMDLPISSFVKNKTFTQLLKDVSAVDQIGITYTNAGQAMTKFNLNSFILWITTQPRQLKQGLI